MLDTMTVTCYHNWYERFLTLCTMLMLMSSSKHALPLPVVLPFAFLCTLLPIGIAALTGLIIE